MSNLEAQSRELYQQASDGMGVFPDVLYIPSRQPAGLANSGLYVNYEDFLDANKIVRMKYESVTGLYHTLVLYFSLSNPDLYTQAYKQLRYNPYNHSAWDKSATTYHYHLLGETLLPYAPERASPEYKIKGVGKVGRKVLRAVLSEEYEEE